MNGATRNEGLECLRNPGRINADQDDGHRWVCRVVLAMAGQTRIEAKKTIARSLGHPQRAHVRLTAGGGACLDRPMQPGPWRQ
ncbi:hypothetical protein XAP7430_1120001 [Xanthomonas phaseoli pv. phaseoli]|uniref:Uncharacterized protein n=1 Tax=Xanthomonas campestris pv. phaseoli TaxID=317013 RepID=A0AB38DVW1_XANCH|nr:hypothetical protein XAP6984_1150001 [Xanthomonas phaseoli pv. phaseoli]SON79788.1 hypothetical protein XAP7430_1120001 [Xanthomonas phaseoli pv. phaseoli]